MRIPATNDSLLPRAERASSLFDQITDFVNLYEAYQGAARGKHDRAATLRHDLHAEKILWKLKWQLETGRYRHGNYRHFVVTEPKARDVHAAPFTDRIVHHAVVQVIEPLLEPRFIYDSYACRRGKGTHAAARRLQHFLRSALASAEPLYVLRADIRKYFASINHEVLKALLARKLPADERLHSLLGVIIDSYHEKQSETDLPLGGAGLPIGNLTSQLCANLYLNELDQFVKHELRARYYLRYMDDFLLLHHDTAELWRILAEIREFTEEVLSLRLHPTKTGIHNLPVASGLSAMT